MNHNPITRFSSKLQEGNSLQPLERFLAVCEEVSNTADEVCQVNWFVTMPDGTRKREEDLTEKERLMHGARMLARFYQTYLFDYLQVQAVGTDDGVVIRFSDNPHHRYLTSNEWGQLVRRWGAEQTH